MAKAEECHSAGGEGFGERGRGEMEWRTGGVLCHT